MYFSFLSVLLTANGSHYLILQIICKHFNNGQIITRRMCATWLLTKKNQLCIIFAHVSGFVFHNISEITHT